MNLVDAFEKRRDELALCGLNGPWILIFDIDSTLMDTGFRNRAILEAAAAEMDELAPLTEHLDAISFSWNVVAPARELGTLTEGALDRLQAFWAARFFTDEWVVRDRPYPGAAEFLHELKKRGFALAYLTGRHMNGMERGTRESFRAHGFPVEDTFFFKPRFEDSDEEFKKAACASISRLGTVVGSLDNEPVNVNLLARSFPHALNVWMKTIASPRPAVLNPGIPETGPECYVQIPRKDTI